MWTCSSNRCDETAGKRFSVKRLVGGVVFS
jgi:hypothetical protein